MRADEAKKIADSNYKPEIDKYFKEVYNVDKLMEHLSSVAKEGYYATELPFDEDDFKKNEISNPAQILILEYFTNYLLELGYNVKIARKRDEKPTLPINGIVGFQWGLNVILEISWS